VERGRRPGLPGWLGYPAVQAAKTALAAGMSWFIAADLLGNNIPVFAPLAALLTVQVTVWESVSRGLQRVLGVVVGVLVAFGFARLAGIHAWSVALVIFVSILAGQALRLGQQGSIQVPVSALLVLVLGASTGGYALDRVVDTAIGAGVGILVNLVVVPPIRLVEARAKVQGVAGALGGLLRQVADDLVVPGSDLSAHLAPARQLSADGVAAALAVNRTATALRWHPGGRRHRPEVERLLAATRALSLVERPARGIARALADAPGRWQPPPSLTQPLHQLLLGVAGEVDAWAARAALPEAVGATSPAADEGTGELYHRALVATRASQVEPETAAIASAIALDAQRISDELREGPDMAPAGPFDWRSLLA
jgi:uncharacterized membrane protein YgaE (UPF0421/DUF939 family)